MPRHEGSRHHDASQGRSSRRHSSSRRSSSFLSSTEEESSRERDRYYPPRSSSNATSSLRRPSSRGGHVNANGNSSSGSGRTSRASNMMLNLLGIRRRERSGSESSATRRVPVVDDVYLKPSVPAYIHNNTGWENMPAPPYNSGTGAATTGPTPPTGAPYALSNIPAQIYYLQPQQSMPAMPTMPAAGGSKENKPAFMGQPAVSTPPLSSHPQFVPSYYTYPPPSMYQWPNTGVPNPMVPMAVPVQGYSPLSSSAASQSHKSRASISTSMHDDGGGRRRSRRPSSSRSSSCSTDRDHGSTRRGSPTRGHRRHHTREMPCSSSVTEKRYRPRRSGTSSRAYSHRSSPLGSRHRRHSPSLPKRAERHYCNGCGRQRSRKFHDANPFKRHKILVSYCLKCRNAYDMYSDDNEIYEDRTERDVRAKSPVHSKSPEKHKKQKASHRVPVSHTIDSITPAMEEAIRALPKAYALPKVNPNAAPKEPLREYDLVKEKKFEAAPVKKSKSKESTRSPLRQPHETVSISSMKKTRGYQPPTVESVLDSGDEEPATHFQPRGTTCAWDSSSYDELPRATKPNLGESNSPVRPRAEVPEAHDERPSNNGSPAQHRVHFETQSRSGQYTQEQATAPPQFANKTKFDASFPPPLSPIITSPCLKKSVRRCASDHVNFEQYRKRHGMAKENQAPIPMSSFMTGASRCCDHVHSGVNKEKLYSQTMPNIPSTPLKRQTRDAYSSPLKPVTHDLCGYHPYTPTMPMPDSGYVPRTFSVHTVSPSLASEQLYQPGTCQNVPPSPKSPVSFKCPSVSASPGSVDQQEFCPNYGAGQSTANHFYSGHTERAMSVVTEEASSPQYRRDENTPFVSHDANVDPVTELGEGMPPYDFDLFSEGQHHFSDGWPQPSPSGEGGDQPGLETADVYEDEDTNGSFDNGYGDSFYSNTVVNDQDGTPRKYHHSFEDDPIIPDYNFDLFSDVTNRWPSPGAEYDKTSETSYSKDSWSKASSCHGTEKENVPTHSLTWQAALAIRNKPRARKPSTLVVEEYNGTDDDATSVASSNSRKRGIHSVVSKTQRFVDCDVISNPDEPDAARTQPPLRCQ